MKKIHLDADMRSVHRRLADAHSLLAMKPEVIKVTPEQMDQIHKILDNPPKPNEKLRKLLTEPSVLEHVS